MKNTDYSNLKSKTIFDFCDDQECIREVIIVPKETFFRELKENPLWNAYALLDYAKRTNNKELKAAVEEQYRKEFDAERDVFSPDELDKIMLNNQA